MNLRRIGITVAFCGLLSTPAAADRGGSANLNRCYKWIFRAMAA